MHDAAVPGSALGEAAAGFAGVVAGFVEEIGREPMLAEVLEIVGWALPVHSDATDGTFTEPLRFTVTLGGDEPYRADGTSQVAELNDVLFESTREVSHALVEHMGAANGTPVTPQQFAAAILQVVRSGSITTADVDGPAVLAITADVPPTRIARPAIGDVLAIPARHGGHHHAVVLGRNRFGTALGLFHPTSPSADSPAAALRHPRPHPVYTEESRIKDGTWKRVGHDSSLLALFPADPPIYHRPGAWPGIVDTGTHGAAETADGELRLIGQDEAREVGLSDGTYRQTRTAAHLEQHLDEQPGTGDG